jgi:hypothetical protein
MSRNVLHWSGLWVLVVALGLMCVGCGGQQKPSATPEVAETISVALAEPVRHELDGQSIELRNCETDTELRRPLASEVEIRIQISIAEEATAVASGESAEIPPEVRAELEAKVELAYQETYERVKASAEQTELTVPAWRIRRYEIDWEEQEFRSTVSFLMNGKAYTASYMYKLCVPRKAGFQEMSCTA